MTPLLQASPIELLKRISSPISIVEDFEAESMLLKILREELSTTLSSDVLSNLPVTTPPIGLISLYTGLKHCYPDVSSLLDLGCADAKVVKSGLLMEYNSAGVDTNMDLILLAKQRIEPESNRVVHADYWDSSFLEMEINGRKVKDHDAFYMYHHQEKIMQNLHKLTPLMPTGKVIAIALLESVPLNELTKLLDKENIPAVAEHRLGGIYFLKTV